MMAAMVLTSLSCSPVVQSPPGAEPIFSGEQAGLHWFLVWQRLTTDALSFQLLIGFWGLSGLLGRSSDSSSEQKVLGVLSQ